MYDPRFEHLELNTSLRGTPYPDHYTYSTSRNGSRGSGLLVGGSGIKYIDYVKKWHMKHPNFTWKQAMKKASKDYKKMTGGSADLVVNPTYHRLPYEGGYGTRRGARKAVRTKRSRGELESETLRGVRTKLRRGEIKHAPSLGMGMYHMSQDSCPNCTDGGCHYCYGMGVLAGGGTREGVLKGIRTKYDEGEIQCAPSLGLFRKGCNPKKGRKVKRVIKRKGKVKRVIRGGSRRSRNNSWLEFLKMRAKNEYEIPVEEILTSHRFLQDESEQYYGTYGKYPPLSQLKVTYFKNLRGIGNRIKKWIEFLDEQALMMGITRQQLQRDAYKIRDLGHEFTKKHGGNIARTLGRANTRISRRTRS